jgi:hypothetical protein
MRSFWRFSDGALRVLFGPEMGFEILRAGMHNRACIYAEQRSAAYAELPFAPCYTHAFILARKVREIDVNAVRWRVAVEDARAQAERYPMPSKSFNISTSINHATYLGWIERYDTITQNDIIDMEALLWRFKTKPLI